MPIEAFAPAKINLTLHVTGRRADGYHLLDSLVVFAGVGDHITVQPAATLSLAIEGPMANGLPAGEDNLVLRAARLLDGGKGAAIRLHKALPVASGIGGGSSDAAATLRALSRLWEVPMPGPDEVRGIGADVPVCLLAAPRRMRGIGDILDPGPLLPPAWLVLANPGQAVPTEAVFAALGRRDNPAMPDLPGRFRTAEALAAFLGLCRNDLEAPATGIAPAIAGTIAALRRAGGCLHARMSGSGATCFGLFAAEAGAKRAAEALGAAHPDWWVAAAPVLGPT